jgi:hypothetical protein
LVLVSITGVPVTPTYLPTGLVPLPSVLQGGGVAGYETVQSIAVPPTWLAKLTLHTAVDEGEVALKA